MADGIAMTAEGVHVVLDALSAVGCSAWVSGGWGVDALVGRQTRPHRDLDLAIDAAHEASALKALIQLGYEIETDWRPVRVELASAGTGWVDLHLVAFDENGDGRQADLDGGFFTYPRSCFATGSISGGEVDCLSVDQQLIFHRGYEPRDVDLADLALLRDL
ncbi:MAG: amino acid transporter [Acidimicrobiaceae bacterium]|nr:amino acid transporter [Acidimicrobiaceae bacterium]